MLSYILHYKNKYPGGLVQSSASGLDVYDAAGNHCVALRRDGSGALVDQSAQLGCKDAHDLSPIPKDSRVFKLSKDGKIVEDEKAPARKTLREAFLKDGKILSCAEFGLEHFDERQAVRPEYVTKVWPIKSEPSQA